MSRQGNTDCLVVGGGLLGLLVAHTLDADGARVALVERGETCREASWAGGGILSPLVPWDYPEPVQRLVGWSQRAYPGLVEELRARTGIDAELVRSGLLMTATPADPAISRWAEVHGCRLEAVAPGELAALEPAATGARGPAVLLPEVAQVRNPRLGRALHAALQARGVPVHTHTEVTGFLVDGGRVHGVRTATGELAADRVVVTGGAWSTALLAETGLNLQVTPVRGQMIQFRAPPGLLRHIVLQAGHYLIQRRDGLLLAGSTLEHTGFDNSVTEEARARLSQQARDLVPALADCPVIRQWAGLRPGSPDGVPIIDEHPGIGGLFVNTGHFRNGVVMAPASARLLADRMQGRASFTTFADFSL